MRRLLSSSLFLLSLMPTLALAQEPFPRWDTVIPGGGTARFTVLSAFNNQAVVDQETGLVWERSPDPTQRTWLAAVQQCVNRSLGGRKGWRLPAVEELTSLVDPTQDQPALPAGHPFTNVGITPETDYFSVTTRPGNTNTVHAVAIGSAGQVVSAAKTALRPYWCVRGGQGVNLQ